MNTKCVVVDSSVAVKWAIKEEDTALALALLADWTEKEITILAPALLSYEVTNVFHQRIRSEAFPFEDAQKALEEIIYDVIGFDFANKTTTHIMSIKLSQQFRLQSAND
jgi:predicted nucleic acid-binding protein